MEAGMVLYLFIFLLVVSLSFAHLPGESHTRSRTPELQHSFNTPFENHGVYWKYGGSTVITKHGVRLTPFTQGRRGWLWNDASLDSDEWEIEVKMRVSSKGLFGGDGFAFWLLHEAMNPQLLDDSDWLSGPVAGLRANFHGLGVVFDTYDNDNMRDNPSIFAISHYPEIKLSVPGVGGARENDHEEYQAADFNFDHNADYTNAMMKDGPVVDKSIYHTAYHSGTNKCVADYRNLQEPFRVMIRYQHKVLHVYLDRENTGYQFCLAVNAPHAMTKSHFAFTAHTGQVADQHDILEVTTRYLSAQDEDIDDSKLSQINDISSFDWHKIFWISCAIFAFLASIISVWQGWLYMQLKSGKINAVVACEKINGFSFPHILLQFILTFVMLISTHWLAFLFNVPLFFYRLYQISTDSYHVDATILITDDPKYHKGVKYIFRVVLVFAFYLGSCVYYALRI